MKLAITALARRTLLVGIIALPFLQGCVPIMVAGIGGTALVVTDRRSAGTVVEDEGIEWKARDLMGKNFGSFNHISVTAYNRTVLLTGEVQDENVKAEAGRLAGSVSNVRGVINELVIGPASGIGGRSNDTAISANIKTRFLGNKVFSANRVKVVTEAGTVFLLGIVTRAEGDQATEIARTSKGVKKVVRAFEYINESEAQAVDAITTENNADSPPPDSDFPPEAP
ncbi:MAG: BON domain-containing protein [Azoarcus sp.]|jgi:osmotically-inducible protein OsmY|nr:BON domain-containing protein [Azoarcus sp.]